MVFDGEGRFVTAVLRPAKRPSGKEIKPFLRRLLRAIRAHWPHTEILLRADSHYCGPEVLDWCRVNGLDYILGVAPTTTLRRHVEALEASTKARFEAAPGDGKLLACDQLMQRCNRVHVERRLRIGVDRRRHAADEEALQVRILAAQDGVDLDEAPLPVERLEVMRHGHEIGLWRQLIGRMAPIGVGENPELAALDESFDASLHAGKVFDARQRPIGDRLRQRSGLCRVRAERVDHVDPIETPVIGRNG